MQGTPNSTDYKDCGYAATGQLVCNGRIAPGGVTPQMAPPVLEPGCSYAATGLLVCDGKPKARASAATERFFAFDSGSSLDTGGIVQRVLAGGKAAMGR